MKPLPIPELSPLQIDAFWSYVAIGDTNDCWLWTGGTNTRKYSKLRYGNWNFRADGVHRILKPHRVAWTLCNGPIPEGMTLDHRCPNTLCVNPSHLTAITLQENLARRGDTTPHKYRHPARFVEGA
jgi:hypothetical protein